MTETVAARAERPVAAAARVQLISTPLAGRREVGQATWLLEFEAPYLARVIKPGQFLMVGLRPPPACAFLKRPFSVADAEDDRITLLLRVYGEGTAEMARRRIGDEFDLLGPFGRPFQLATSATRVVMVAGGIGLAPFYLLARRLKASIAAPETVLVYGERTLAAVTSGLESFGFFDRVLTYVEDGTAELRGTAVAGFRRLAQEGELAGARLCACGRRAMLEALEVERERLGVPGEYSMEERMGCGFGICQGCAVTANPARSSAAYHLLCKAGPVMNPELVQWPHQVLP